MTRNQGGWLEKRDTEPRACGWETRRGTGGVGSGEGDAEAGESAEGGAEPGT